MKLGLHCTCFYISGLEDTIAVNQIAKGEKRSRRKDVKRSFKKVERGVKSMSTTDKLTKGAEGVGFALSAAQKFSSIDDSTSTSEKVLTGISGVLDIVSAVSGFLPPPVSTITPVLTGVLEMFLPGPPPQPTTTEVIRQISDKIDKGFKEQQMFITKAFHDQKMFITKEFDNLKSDNQDLFNKEFLKETKMDSLALLEEVQEKYEYISLFVADK